MTDTNCSSQDNYYHAFDALSNNGRILDKDLSNMYDSLDYNITNDERNARSKWKSARDRIKKDYKNNEKEEINTKQSLLQERLVPPKFHLEQPSRRNHEGRKGTYAHQIQSWDDFDKDVQQFSLEGGIESQGGDIDLEDFQVFKNSLNDKNISKNEEHEKLFLETHLFEVFEKAGIIGGIRNNSSGPDIVLYEKTGDKQEFRIMVECKSTQNLLLPMKAKIYDDNNQEYKGVVQRYNNGIKASSKRDHNGKHVLSKDKQYVCKPLAQLFSYMLEFKVRCGALTSATRTYFVFFQDDGNEKCKNVYVSNAWFVGQQNYLRAWAYFYDFSHNKKIDNDDDVSWNTDDTSYQSDRGDGSSDSSDNSNMGGRGSPVAFRTRSAAGNQAQIQSKGGSKGNEKHRKEIGELDSTYIPTIPYHKIKFLNPIGHAGRNGGVFCAEWEGKKVAVKQFDISHPEVLKRFQKEKKAYEILKSAQGILIPKVWFLAKSKAGVACLGMDMGYKSNYGEEKTMEMLKEVIEDLKLKHGFYHQDVSRANCIVINDINKKRKLVAIDFEEYDWKPLKY